jgi:hypothetical protein
MLASKSLSVLVAATHPRLAGLTLFGLSLASSNPGRLGLRAAVRIEEIPHGCIRSPHD